MAYRKTARTEARKADIRRRLIDVARQIVAEGGFTAIQISTVAQLAGVATGTVYRYFPSKADLSAEVFHVISQHEIDVAAEISLSGGSAADRLVATIRAVASRAIQGRITAYALIAEPADEAIDTQRLVHKRALARVFERILEDGIAKSEFPQQNVEASAACIVGAVMESLVSPLAPDSTSFDKDGRSLFDAVAGFCLRGILEDRTSQT